MEKQKIQKKKKLKIKAISEQSRIGVMAVYQSGFTILHRLKDSQQRSIITDTINAITQQPTDLATIYSDEFDGLYTLFTELASLNPKWVVSLYFGDVTVMCTAQGAIDLKNLF